MKKKILLGGFNKKQILFLKKNNKKNEFYVYKKNQKEKVSYFDAFISITRRSFEDFYYNDLHKYRSSISWIHIAGAGIDKYFKNKNEIHSKCKVTHNKIIQGPQVADHAMALLLSLTRNINLIVKNGPYYKFKNRPIELRGKKALVVGYGGIGRCLVERAKGFGLNVDVVNKNYSPISNLVSRFYLLEEYEKALKDKDIIFYTLPLTTESKKMFNKRTVRFIKKDAFIINVCRGDVMCYETLYKYLKNNYLRGAGSDVLDVEPIKKNNKLLKLSNFLYTPHLASISDQLPKRIFKLITDNINRYNNNDELINQANIKMGY